MGDGNVAEVEAIGVFRLPLKNDIVLEFQITISSLGADTFSSFYMWTTFW